MVDERQHTSLDIETEIIESARKAKNDILKRNDQLRDCIVKIENILEHYKSIYIISAHG